MTVSIRRFPSTVSRLGLACAAIVLAAGAQAAADGHGGAAPHGAEAAPGHAAAGPRPAAPDPMAALREKLAARLGAETTQQPQGGKVVRVVARPADAHGSAAAGGGHGDAPAAGGGDGHGASPQAAADQGAAHGGGLVAKLEHEQAKAHGAAKTRRPGRRAAKHSAHAPHWDYAGPGGPEFWGGLKPEFTACARGSRQSPIDIRHGVNVDLAPIAFEYEPSEFSVIDNGHTVQVNVAGGNSIEVMGRRYDLVQFHFHRPSEERINGRQFDMSLHLVHRDPEGRLAVVAVLLDRGEVHPVVQTVWNNLPLEKHQEQQTEELLDPGHLLPPDRRYYTYMGSLTTPPCTEGVLWMVMQQTVGVDKEQLRIFSRLYPMNARPVQQASGRLIKASN